LVSRFQDYQYDAALLLDSDAVIVDLDFDVLKLLPFKYLFAAHKIYPSAPNTTWEINNGVTLWNLDHPDFDRVVDRWEHRCKEKIEMGKGVSDQGPLHHGLRADWTGKQRAERGLVRALATPHFETGNGTFVNHFIRDIDGVPQNWSDAGGTYFVPNEDRLVKIQSAVDRVCQKWPTVCKDSI